MNGRPKPLPQDFANAPAPQSEGNDHAHVSPVAAANPGNGPAAATAGLRIALDYLCTRDDGWLRLIPARDGSPSYAKWKFTHGRHAGKYIMVVRPGWDSLALFELLVEQLHKVDVGDLRPTLDKYFSLD